MGGPSNQARTASTVTVVDSDVAQVLIVPSNGSTDLSEANARNFKAEYHNLPFGILIPKLGSGQFQDSAVSDTYQVVLTKIDKIHEAGLPRLISETLERIRKRPAAFPSIIATSSEKGVGMDDLRDAILLAVRGG